MVFNGASNVDIDLAIVCKQEESHVEKVQKFLHKSIKVYICLYEITCINLRKFIQNWFYEIVYP